MGYSKIEIRNTCTDKYGKLISNFHTSHENNDTGAQYYGRVTLNAVVTTWTYVTTGMSSTNLTIVVIVEQGDFSSGSDVIDVAYRCSGDAVDRTVTCNIGMPNIISGVTAASPVTFSGVGVFTVFVYEE